MRFMSDDEKKDYLIQLRLEAQRRFRYLWIASLSTILMTMILCTILIITHNSTQTITLTAIGGLALTNLWPMLKKEQNERIADYHRSLIETKVEDVAQKAEQVVTKVEEIEKKTNGDLKKAVETVGKEIREAKNEPAPGQEVMPRTREELQAMMHEFATKFCDDLVMDRIEEKLKEAFQRQKQMMKDLGQGI